MAFGESGRTERGVTPLAAVPALVQAGADVVGANCAVGPEMTLDALWKMREADVAAESDGRPLPLSAQPNAGFPQQVDGRLLYQSGPEYFARFAPRAFEAGARLIGGCCGTTPAHIAAMQGALSAVTSGAAAPANIGAQIGQPAAALVRYPQIGGGASSAGGAEDAAPTAAGKAAATFADKLGRQFVVSVEIDPPKGMNPKKALEGAQMLHAQGVDVINIADSPMARVRMGCIALAHLMQAEVGIETVIHFTCRDRNLMALQSDLIGAHALGLRNILALTGDRTRHSDYPGATDIFNVESWGLVRILSRMNEGVDLAGNSLGRKARFTIGCAASPAEPDLDKELERYRRKVEAGAHFVFTQPLWELATLERWLERTADLPRLPMLLGIWPLQSARQTEFLVNEVPGIYIPDEVRRRMAEAPGEDAQKVGVELAQNLLRDAAGLVQGVYLMPSFGRYEVCAEVLEAAPRPVAA
jgi:homocysteine S-methyltransferase